MIFYLLIGVIIGYLLTRSSDKVLFFPDPKLPCKKFYYSLMDRQKRRCMNRNCQYAHENPERTSFMEILFELSEAKRTIDLAIYLITHDWITDLLIDLHTNKGVQVRVVTDTGKDTERRKKDQSHKLQLAGIQVKANYNEGDALMHNKFVVIDNKKVIVGSFNWTTNAITKNHESVMICTQRLIVDKFWHKFEEMWNRFDDRDLMFLFTIGK